MESTVRNLNQGQRKRTSAKLQERHKLRAKKYTNKDPLGLEFKKPCSHKEKSKFRCNCIKVKDVVKLRKMLHKNEDKVHQDIFLSRFINPYKTQRSRPSKSNIKKPRKFSVNYYVSKDKRMVRVCKQFFQQTFLINSRRLNTIGRTLYKGDTPQERRGGDRLSSKYKEKKEKVLSFLKSLPAVESHYNRSKSKRCYLSCDLTIAKLRKIYNNSVNESLQVKKTYFWKLFNLLNIGFCSPASDVCSKCFLLKQKIKKETDSIKKQEYITEYRIHKLKANTFYELLRTEESDSLTLCFDLEQVQPLPRTPIEDSFYARLLNFYALCVTSKDTKNPTFYTWTEDQAGRGSVCVGSALLCHFDKINLKNIKTLRLFCDGCGGQNKNQHIVHALMFWLLHKAPSNLQEIKLFFPVRGHSFLPADRVFARVEKDMRKVPFIPTTEEYYDIYERHGRVMKLGGDWELLDIKSLSDYCRPIIGIQSIKRIYFKRSQTGHQCLLKLFENFRYENAEKYSSFMKRGKRFPSTLEYISLGNTISLDKKKDVSKLLVKQYGESWSELPELVYYKKILLDTQSNDMDCLTESRDNECDCVEMEGPCARI